MEEVVCTLRKKCFNVSVPPSAYRIVLHQETFCQVVLFLTPPTINCPGVRLPLASHGLLLCWPETPRKSNPNWDAVRKEKSGGHIVIMVAITI